MKKFSRLSNTTKVITIGVAVLAVVGAFFIHRNITTEPQANTGTDSTGINYSPPTEQEIKEAEDNKANVDERAGNDSSDAQNPSASKKQVSVVITNASVNSINSYASGVFEDGGICTATLTQGSKQVQRTSDGFKDATHTSCMPIFLSRSDFPASGTWTVKVSYSSSTSEGQSQSVNIEVQ